MKYLLSTIILALTVFAGTAQAAEKESAFERVMRTGVIRCGYYVFPPVTKRDPNTNELSGLSIDMMNRLAERAALKVEWTEEVTFGNWVPAMQANRFDLICTPMWPDLPQAKAVLFTHSLFYAGKYPVVMADNARFNEKTTIKELNNESVTFIAQEGNMTLNTTRGTVPNAKFYVLPASADGGEYYQAIVTKKADAVITDSNAVYQWNSSNPDQKMRILQPDNPIMLQQFPLVVERHEWELRDFINLAIDEMNNAGEIDALLKKWEPEPGKTYLRVAQPFKAAE